MAEGDPFQDWLDDFRRGVDETLSRSSRPSSPAALHAQEAFQNWWQAEHEPVAGRGAGEAEALLEKEPPARGGLLPPELGAQIERLTADKAELEKRLEDEARAKADGEKRVSELERALAEAEVRFSEQRQRLETQLSDLQRRLDSAEESASSLREAKTFMEQSAHRLSLDAEGLKHELALARENAALAARQSAAFADQVAALEKERERLREALASQNGALDELRRQADGYQRRLVEAKELTDADVALMRQDLKFFMEELKLIRNTIKRGD